MTDVRGLASELGISEKALRKLEKDKGDLLEPLLRRWVRETRDAPRLLRKSPPRGVKPTDALSEASRVKAAEESAYTHSAYSAMTDAGEAVSYEVQAEYSRVSHHNFGVLRAEEQTKQRARALSNQIRELTTKLMQADVDPKPFHDQLWKAAQEAERKVDRAA